MTYVSSRDKNPDQNNTSGRGTPKTSSEITLQCAKSVEIEKNITLSRESRAKFVSSCGEHAFCVLVSKDHKGQGKYWYGIFDHQLEWFESIDSPNKWFVFACGGPQLMFVVPLEEVEQWKEKLSSRYLEDRGRTYWHANMKY